jgi:hypothetical protein
LALRRIFFSTSDSRRFFPEDGFPQSPPFGRNNAADKSSEEWPSVFAFAFQENQALQVRQVELIHDQALVEALVIVKPVVEAVPVQ